MSTRIEGPRSAPVRFSTGRMAVLRAVPSFRAMLREGLIDKHDEANIQDVLEGRIPASLLGDAFEDALLRHMLIDPAVDLSLLDDVEAQEIVRFAFRAYLSSQQASEPAEYEDDDDTEAEPVEQEDEPEVVPAAPADHDAAEQAIHAAVAAADAPVEEVE